jgi:uncharacterized spore protein YtfJ
MDQNQAFTQNVDALFTNLENFTKKESVLGSPVTYGDKTLIPVMSIMLGYGSGTSSNSANQQNTMMNANNNANANAGVGLGLGARITTDAVVVIDKDNVSMLSISGKNNLSSMMDKIPEAILNMNKNNQQTNQQMNQQANQTQNSPLGHA